MTATTVAARDTTTASARSTRDWGASGPVVSAGRGVPSRPPTIARLVTLEIRKSLSTRSGRLLAAAAAALPAVGAAMFFAVSKNGTSAVHLLGLLGTLAAMLMLAIGILSTAGEWTHHTVQTTFLAVPRRHRILLAKYAGMALLGAAVAAVMVASSLAVAAIATVAGATFSWASAGPAVAATVCTAAAFTVIGAGIGAAVANAPAALTGTYLTFLVAMSLLEALTPTTAKVDPVRAMTDLITGVGSKATAAVVLTVWVAATTTVGAAITRRRAAA